jgi:hypothetical protein
MVKAIRVGTERIGLTGAVQIVLVTPVSLVARRRSAKTG